MTSDRYATPVRGTNNRFEDRLRDAVVDLDEVYSLIDQKIYGAFRSLRCIGNDADLRPERRITVKNVPGKKESWTGSLARVNLLTRESQKS